MKKNFITSAFVVASALTLALSTSCQFNINVPEDDYTDRLVVNGTTWALRNVAVPGMFTPRVEDYGGYFDFATARTVCPLGWRTPTQREWAQLLSVENYWSTQNGIRGRVFYLGDRSMFLPAGGYMEDLGGAPDATLHGAGRTAYYWSCTTTMTYDGEAYYSAWFDHSHTDLSADTYADGLFNVRCVK